MVSQTTDPGHHCPQSEGFFLAWYHVCRFTHPKRTQQQIARDVKRQRVRDLLHEVDSAAAVHDNFGVYQAVHRFTPKSPHKRIRLRLQDGTIAAPDVLRLPREHALAVWDGPANIPYTCHQPPALPFTQDELEQEWLHIPVVKSVARPCLPGLCWKIRARETASYIYGLLQEWWTRNGFHVPIHGNKPGYRLSTSHPRLLTDCQICAPWLYKSP